MTGQGGWPLNAFLTPEQIPFYGGTYFPPEPRHGMPSWRQVLGAVADAWEQRRDEIRERGGEMAKRLAGGALLQPSAEPIQQAGLDRAVENLEQLFDPQYGGWGPAPKFPAASTIEFLLARGEDAHEHRDAARHGLGRALRPGRRRLCPLQRRHAVGRSPTSRRCSTTTRCSRAPTCTAGRSAATPILRRTCEETLDWVLRDMRAPEGGFYSALDADSEGVEGKFYVWSLDELEESSATTPRRRSRTSGPPGAAISRAPNHLTARGPALERRRARRARTGATARARATQRVWPGLDDKRLAGWNALMISALADAGAVLGREDFLDAARARRRLRPARGCATTAGACCARSTPARRGSTPTSRTTRSCSRRCWISTRRRSSRAGSPRRARWPTRSWRASGIPSTAASSRRPTTTSSSLARRKDLEDAPIPSGGSSAAFGLLRLSALTGEHDYERHAVGQLRLLHEIAPRHPTAFGHLLRAIDFHLRTVREVALVGPDRERRAARGRGAIGAAARRSCSPEARAAGVGRAIPLLQRPGAGRRARRRLRLRALRLPAAGHRARGSRGAIGSVFRRLAVSPHDSQIRRAHSAGHSGPRRAGERVGGCRRDRPGRATPRAGRSASPARATRRTRPRP